MLLTATGQTPTLFAFGFSGLVESFHRPGGNITGINIMTDLLEAKRLGLLHELVPKAATIGFLWNPRFGSAAANQLPDAQAAARALGLQLRALPVSSTDEIDAAFDLIGREQILALAVSADPFLDTSRDRIIALAARHSVPTMYQFREHTVAGGLMSYGIDRDDAFRQAGGYAARAVEVNIRVLALDRPIAPGFDRCVDLLVQVRHGRGRHPCAPQRLRDVLDPAHRYPCQIHLDQRLFDRALAPPVALDDRRLECLPAQLRYPQPHLAGLGLQAALVVAGADIATSTFLPCSGCAVMQS